MGQDFIVEYPSALKQTRLAKTVHTAPIINNVFESVAIELKAFETKLYTDLKSEMFDENTSKKLMLQYIL